MSPMTPAERTYCASEFFFKGIFSTLVEVAKDQKAGDPAFIIGNFARAFGPEAIATLPEFHCIECSGKAWEVGFWNQDNNPESVWIVENGGEYVTTTCKHIVGLLELKHIQELPWSKFNWEEAAKRLPPLDNLWDWSGKQAVIDMMAFTRLHYQVEKHLTN
jgi:hypothetical protein